MPKRILQGTVVSNKNDKTISVSVVRKIMHPVYKKYIKRTKKYSAHDESNACELGQIVKIQETKPISKKKKWILIN
ncbi:MAG: 30S ribosomal protein S17 [Rickettsiales bacterium]|jgi:small subunit ribosomal protein S17|nr:30S ribosomal protein S17 [Rickettsiales bacterium]|tara:strand:- start:1344 stop:1571 length:228 start_codon:yes stop_codon:yes gene_type:complete